MYPCLVHGEAQMRLKSMFFQHTEGIQEDQVGRINAEALELSVNLVDRWLVHVVLIRPDVHSKRHAVLIQRMYFHVSGQFLRNKPPRITSTIFPNDVTVN